LGRAPRGRREKKDTPSEEAAKRCPLIADKLRAMAVATGNPAFNIAADFVEQLGRIEDCRLMIARVLGAGATIDNLRLPGAMRSESLARVRAEGLEPALPCHQRTHRQSAGFARGCGKTPTFNLRVESPSPLRQSENQ
jgi:hypothetical protein